ncbi:MAG: TlpA disulfide reductase family protein [Bacteroidota bacterium]
MNKLIYTAFAFLFALACKTGKEVQANQPTATTALVCQLDGATAEKQLHLYQFDGLGFNIVKSATLNEQQQYLFEVVAGKTPGYYYLGTDLRNRKTLLLGTEAKVVLTGDINSLNRATAKGSVLNEQHEALKRTMQEQKNSTNRLMRSYQKAAENPTKATAVAKQLAELDTQKKTLLDSLKKTQSFLAHIASMNIYLSFPNNKGTYPNELAYFIAEYFSHVELDNPVMNHIPPLYEQFRSYVQTLAKVGLTDQSLTEVVDKHLAKIPADAYSYRYALGGVVNGLMQANHGSFVAYGERYLDKYGAEATKQVENLKKKVSSLRSLVMGAEAPDFTATTPEGEDMSLSELRGKVVMIDFWASWCGPCRRENPNVVALYNKYKSKGFEILGVSLDRSKAPWLKAIETDGLTWHHVSDLKGWKNEVAQMYNVSSIPQTILLNEQGEIIARNLRGEQLAQRLAEIFD